jgi:hypothetical protein
MTTIPSIGIDSGIWGVCFSPNDSLVYTVGRAHLYQYDPYDPDTSTAITMLAEYDTTDVAFSEFMVISKGHDQKLYIGNRQTNSSSISRIDYPNVRGVGAGFCPKCIDFPAPSVVNNGNGCCVYTPPIMPNYTLGADTTTSIGTPQAQLGQPILKVYPNPATHLLNIAFSGLGNGETARFKLKNMIGQEVASLVLSGSNGFASLDIAGLPAGVYVYSVTSNNGSSQTGKLVISR